jgi:hypothetical protein
MLEVKHLRSFKKYKMDAICHLSLHGPFTAFKSSFLHFFYFSMLLQKLLLMC